MVVQVYVIQEASHETIFKARSVVACIAINYYMEAMGRVLDACNSRLLTLEHAKYSAPIRRLVRGMSRRQAAAWMAEDILHRQCFARATQIIYVEGVWCGALQPPVSDYNFNGRSF